MKLTPLQVYLTALFIIPLRGLYSYQNNANPTLHRMAKRSLIGSLATLTTSVVNLTILMVLKGEPGWICLMCCNADILFCVLVLHWVTSKDKTTVTTNPQSGMGGDTLGSRSETRSRQKRHSELMYGNGTVDEKQSEVITIKGLSDDTQNSNSISSTTNSGRNSRRPSLNVFPCSINTHNPHHHNRPQTSPRLVLSSVTTEFKSSSPPSRFRTPSRGMYRTPTREEFEDEIELNNIRVQTIHTREVEIDDEGRERTESVRSEGEEWVGHEQRVVGEGVV
jgi:hypothetical protein